MRRWFTFLSGVVVGGLLLYGVLNFHLLRASDGLHVIPKINAQVAGTYVDVRNFSLRDWVEHPEIIAALRDAGRNDLIETATGDAIHTGLDRLLGAGKAEK